LEKNSERQKGKFDARYLTSSDEEEDEISDQEEMKEEPKKLERAKEGHKGTKSLLKKRAEATKTETYQNVK
jgi:DNA-binding transcriptional regulator GbsR (MarR family)